MTFVVFLLIIAAIIYYCQKSSQKDQENIVKIKYALKRDHIWQDVYIDSNGKSAIAINDDQKQICLISNKNELKKKIINYKDIIGSEVFIDGVSITKTNRSSQIGGAVVGGVLFGGVGAIVGGLSGSNTTTEEISKISLKITINDIHDPYHVIEFLNCTVKKNGLGHSLYEKALENANIWYSRISVILNQEENLK